MEGNKRVNVTIQGNNYAIKGDVSEEYISKIASEVDHIITELRKSNSLINTNMAAVLCSLNLADQLYRAQEKIAELEDKLLGIENIPELENQLEKYKQEAIYNLEKYKEAQKNLTEANFEREKYYEMVESFKDKIKQDKIEIDAARQTIMDLQNQIFDNQIEIVKMKKELDEYRHRDVMDKKIYPYPKGKNKS